MSQVDIVKIAGLPINNKSQTLIVKRKGKPIWFSLGGKLENGETEVECLIRETKEELNADVIGEVRHFVTTPVEIAVGTKDTSIIIKFYTMMLSNKIEVDDDEIEDYKWIGKKEYQDLLNDKSIEIGSGLVKYAIPKLIAEGLMK